MKGNRFRVDQNEIVSQDNFFSIDSVRDNFGKPKFFPKEAYDKLLYLNDGGGFGWKKLPTDIEFTFKDITVDYKCIELSQEFAWVFNCQSFIKIDEFEGGRGDFITPIASWLIEFIASYAAGKMLDNILKKLNDDKTIKTYSELEEYLKAKAIIQITLGKESYHNRTLMIRELKETLPRLNESEIDKIMKEVQSTSNMLTYDHEGLHKYDYYTGQVFDKKI